MVYKTPKVTFKVQSGLTFVEVLITAGLLMVLLSAAMVVLNPPELQARGRDDKRLSDLMTLDRAINEYRLDHNAYPDTPNTHRQSNLLPAGNSGPFENTTRGWLMADLSAYNSKLPVDPLNDTTHFYSYQHNGINYEINAVMEYLIDEAGSDGGNSPTQYEMGTDLTIL